MHGKMRRKIGVGLSVLREHGPLALSEMVFEQLASAPSSRLLQRLPGARQVFSRLLFAQQPYIDHYLNDPSGATAVPSSALLDLTYMCNLKCTMCLQAIDLLSDRSMIKENRRTHTHLELEDWKGIVDKLQAGGVQSITLSGGEVFIVPYATQLIEFILDRGLRLSVGTNGTRVTDAIADLLVRDGVDHIVVSMDGPDAESHNRVRKHPDAFRTATEGMRRINEAKRRRGGGPVLGINFTVSAENYLVLPGMPALAARYDAELSVAMLQFLTGELPAHIENDTEHKGECRHLPEGLRELDAARLREGLGRLRSEAARLGVHLRTAPSRLSDEEIVAWFTDPDYRYADKCLAPWDTINVDPFGRLVMCNLGTCTGNLAEQPLEDVLNSEKYKAFRRELRECGVWDECTHCCMLSKRSWSYVEQPVLRWDQPPRSRPLPLPMA